MEILGARPVWSMSSSEQLLTLDAARTEISRLQTLCLHLTAGLDESGYAAELGARDTIELLSERHRLHPRDVRRDLNLAKALPKYRAVSAALPDPTTDLDLDLDLDLDGDLDADAEDDTAAETSARMTIHPAQAQVIVAALEKLPDTVPVDDIDVAEQELVKLARLLNPVDLRKAAKHVCDLLDTDGLEPAEEKAYEREALSLRDADHGVKFSGYLANENAELLRALIHAGAKPHKTFDGELDPRPRDKRQADALTTILNTAAAAAASDTFVPGDGPKAHITITADLEDLRSGASGAGIGDLVYGDGLSAEAVRRLTCDGAITPIILGKNSVPLDVGLTKRFVTGHIRKALNFRDRGCVICGSPPVTCDAHHLVHWIDGGHTKLCNLVLLCKMHHRALHAGRWTIHIIDGIPHVERPSWADPDPTTRIRYRPPPTAPPPPTPTVAHTATPTTAPTTGTTGSTTAPFDPWGDSASDTVTGTVTDTKTVGTVTSRDAAAFDPWADIATANC